MSRDIFIISRGKTFPFFSDSMTIVPWVPEVNLLQIKRANRIIRAERMSRVTSDTKQSVESAETIK